MCCVSANAIVSTGLISLAIRDESPNYPVFQYHYKPSRVQGRGRSERTHTDAQIGATEGESIAHFTVNTLVSTTSPRESLNKRKSANTFDFDPSNTIHPPTLSSNFRHGRPNSRRESTLSKSTTTRQSTQLRDLVPRNLLYCKKKLYRVRPFEASG